MNRNEPPMPHDERRRSEEMRAQVDERVRNRQEVAPSPPPFERVDRADPADRGQQPERIAHRAPGAEHARESAPPRRGVLLSEGEADRLQSRWSDIQAAFVDEPREAVRKADSLVNDVTRRINEVFTAERSALEKQWDRGDQVTTEDLRVALQRYRSFFDHLLSF